MSKISVKRNVNDKLDRAEDQTKMEGPEFKMIYIFMEDKFLYLVSTTQIHDYRYYTIVWNNCSNVVELCNN